MISLAEGLVKLTFTWAEAEFLVPAVVSCGGAPWQVVRAAIGGAGGVGFALESEGEVAHGTIRIPIASLHSLGDRQILTFNAVYKVNTRGRQPHINCCWWSNIFWYV